MDRNFHRQFLEPEWYGTAAEAAAQEIEDLQVQKSWAVCDDSVDWSFWIEEAQAKLAAILSTGCKSS